MRACFLHQLSPPDISTSRGYGYFYEEEEEEKEKEKEKEEEVYYFPRRWCDALFQTMSSYPCRSLFSLGDETTFLNSPNPNTTGQDREKVNRILPG